jgi:hypothetical protein
VPTRCVLFHVCLARVYNKRRLNFMRSNRGRLVQLFNVLFIVKRSRWTAKRACPLTASPVKLALPPAVEGLPDLEESRHRAVFAEVVHI